MNLHRAFAGLHRPVETCVVGTGGFGRSFLAQAPKVPLMRARVALDRDAASVAEVLAGLGVPLARIRICRDRAEAARAWSAGEWIAAEDLAVVLELPLDVVVEATGHPESGARHALMAIEAGKHVALVSKEVDSVVGPILADLAAQRGTVVTPVDGDQPSLLIGLVSWAQTLGFEIVCAGKSSEYDFVYDAAAGRITSNGREIDVPGFSATLSLGERDATALVGLRATLAAALPQRAVPDLCELQVVANATGLAPDVPTLHAPIARVAEVPSLLCLREDGGLLAGANRLDVFHCLRSPGELSFAGGVFVVIRCEDAASWRMLEEKGHVLGRRGTTAMIGLPRHLLGLEAATSVIGAALGQSTGGLAPHPHLDLIARATEDLPAGTLLTAGGHHHTIAGVGGELRPAAPLSGASPVPFYLVADRRLQRPVRAGRCIVLDDLAIEPDSTLLALRLRQDRRFFGGVAGDQATAPSGIA